MKPETAHLGRAAWGAGSVPVAVVMISYNEAHNIPGVLDNLSGWASEVFLLDSFSTDATVDLALDRGVQVAQRRFDGFGNQWNYAITHLPIRSGWVMKLDPDERLTDRLKEEIGAAIRSAAGVEGITLRRTLWFMGKKLPIAQILLRVWRNGACRFTDDPVNERPVVRGALKSVEGDLEHHDSPNLHHWVSKQNRYSTVEALHALNGQDTARFGDIWRGADGRRAWARKYVLHTPAGGPAAFLHAYVFKGAWRAGTIGFAWSLLRGWVYLMRWLKIREMQMGGRLIELPPNQQGPAHPGAIQASVANRPTVGENNG